MSVCVEANSMMDEMIETESVMRGQIFSKTGRGLSGAERKLMAAVLSDGVEAYMEHMAKGAAQSYNDAVEWVETRDYSYVFSFDVVCESLGIDPEYLRKGLSTFADQIKFSDENTTRWKKIRRPRK